MQTRTEDVIIFETPNFDKAIEEVFEGLNMETEVSLIKITKNYRSKSEEYYYVYTFLITEEV